jgi:hypothetical protein
MVTAKFIEDLPSINGTKKLWELDEALYVEDLNDYTNYVITSAIYVGGDAETFIFPADDNGSIINYLELPGSIMGEEDHYAAIERAGWIVDAPDRRPAALLAHRRPYGVIDEPVEIEQPYDEKVEEVKEDELAISLVDTLDE